MRILAAGLCPGGGSSSYPNDPSRIATEFFDSSGRSLAPPSCGTGRHRTYNSNSTDWNWQSLSRIVPKDTHRIRFYIEFAHNSGSWNDGYADDVSLQLRFPSFRMTEPAVSTSYPIVLDFGNVYLATNESAGQAGCNKAIKNIRFRRITNWWLNRVPSSGSNECRVLLDEDVQGVINSLTFGEGTPIVTRDSYIGYRALQVDATGSAEGSWNNRIFSRDSRQRYSYYNAWCELV